MPKRKKKFVGALRKSVKEFVSCKAQKHEHKPEIVQAHLWSAYYQTPAQPPFRGHLPWSRRRCPMNIGSTVFRSPYQGKMPLI